MCQNILIIGDSGVGKTNIINRLLNKSFNNLFIPNEFTKVHKIKDTEINIYDYPGQLKFMPIFPLGITKVIIVYDMTSRLSYKNIIGWQNLFKECVHNDIPYLIVGNKSDSKNVKISTGITISAKTNHNLDLITDFITTRQ